MTRPKGQPKRSSLTRRADRLFSLVVRSRDGECRRCGGTDELQAAHVFRRRFRAVRWDERNAVALCADCHHHFTVHPLEEEDFFRAMLGAVYDDLRILARDGDPELPEDAIERLKARLRELSEGVA